MEAPACSADSGSCVGWLVGTIEDIGMGTIVGSGVVEDDGIRVGVVGVVGTGLEIEIAGLSDANTAGLAVTGESLAFGVGPSMDGRKVGLGLSRGDENGLEETVGVESELLAGDVDEASGEVDSPEVLVPGVTVVTWDDA